MQLPTKHIEQDHINPSSNKLIPSLPQHESLPCPIPFHHRCIPAWTRNVWWYAQQESRFVDETGGRGESAVSIVADLYSSIVSLASVVHYDKISWRCHLLTIILLLFAHILTHKQRQLKVCQVNLERQVFQVKVIQVSQEREIIQVSQEFEIQVFQEREFTIINHLGYVVIGFFRFLRGLLHHLHIELQVC